MTHEFYPKRGGIATYVQELAAQLHAMEQTVEVWAPQHTTLADSGLRCPVVGMPLRGTHGWADRVRFASWLRSRAESYLRETFFILAEPGPLWAFLWSDLLAQPHGLRYGLILHGSELARILRRPNFRERFMGVAALAAFIGVVSAYNQKMFLGAFPELAEKVLLMPGGGSGVQMENRHAPLMGTKVHDNVSILTVARIHPRKGQMALLEAIADLPAVLRKKVCYRAVGPIVHRAYAQSLRDFAESNAIALELPGVVEEKELATYYRQADIFALTSMPYRDSVEGLGLVYLDAARIGLPLLAHRIGGVEDVVQHGVNGLLADPFDRKTLTDALHALLSDDKMRMRLAANGPASVSTYSWERVAHAVINGVYRSPRDVLNSNA